MIESFLFLFTGIIGVITIGLMITSYKSNPFYNFYLFIIIALVSMRFLVHGSFELGIQNFLKADRGSNSILFLVVVPCAYLYHKNLVLQKRNYNIKDLKHFVFIGLLYVMNTTNIIKYIFGQHLGPISNFIMIGVFIAFYLGLIFLLLRKHIWFKKDLLINNKHFNLVRSWTIYLFALNTLACLGVVLSIYLESSKNSILSGKSQASIFLISWLFIYFKILTSPEILYGLPILNKKLLKFSTPTVEEKASIEIKIHDNWILEKATEKNSQDQKLQEKLKSNITKYVEEVDKLSFSEHIFRDTKTSQANVAQSLGVPTSHIVYLFKYHSKITFSEYRMQSRIEDALILIGEDYLKVNTLESLAYNTGFASYNPFFSAFKKVTGMSPQDHLKKSKIFT